MRASRTIDRRRLKTLKMKNIQTSHQRPKTAHSGPVGGAKRALRAVYYTPEDITLKLLAAMGVERGVRFLDAYGKSIFTR
jgi:hypothetical protein